MTACGGEGGTPNVAEEVSPSRMLVRQNLTTAPGARALAMEATDRPIYAPTVEDGAFVMVVAARETAVSKAQRRAISPRRCSKLWPPKRAGGPRSAPM